jgi:dimethylhistidine N-methyltransferase
MTTMLPLRKGTRVVLHDLDPTPDDLLDAVLRGLARQPRTLPCKFLYNEVGARWFERICTTEAYYPTRTEIAILDRYAPGIAACVGPGARIVELGSGSVTKTRILLGRLERPAAYVPVDISRAQLVEVALALATEYPTLEVAPVCADYTRPFEIPEPEAAPHRTIAFFPGSTLGNFEPAEAEAFLRSIAGLVGPGGGMLLGVDLEKDAAVLEHAYDDPGGVTAAFNLNLLRRINRECGATFDLAGWEHRAVYDAARSRIEMHLVSRWPQRVRLRTLGGGVAEFGFGAGEYITTEHSYKYTPERLRALAERAGFRVASSWTDPRGWFSVQYLVREGEGPSRLRGR